MGAPDMVSGRNPVLTEHERFKSRSRLRFWVGMGVAGLLHMLLFLRGPGLRPVEFSSGVGKQEMQALRLTSVEVIERQEIRRPAPPPPPLRGTPVRRSGSATTSPARRVVETGLVPRAPSPPAVVEPGEEIAEWVEAAREMASSVPAVEVPSLPAPAPTEGIPGLSEYRHVNALMQKPELVNRGQIRRALLREYPRELQRDRVEGSVLVWFWIDEKGKIQHYEIRASSGHMALDTAAERVIPKMKFRPAKERGKAVPVIVALPITFEVE